MKRRHGFTIVELLVVIAIIASLALMTVFAFGLWRKRTAKAEMRQELTMVAASLKTYRTFQNVYPGVPGGAPVDSKTLSGMTYRPNKEAAVKVAYTLRSDGQSYCLRAESRTVQDAPKLYIDSAVGESPVETPCS